MLIIWLVSPTPQPCPSSDLLFWLQDWASRFQVLGLQALTGSHPTCHEEVDMGFLSGLCAAEPMDLARGTDG